MKTVTSQDLLTSLKRFLSIRYERYDNLNKNIIAFENRQESIEGTAQYVEHKLSDKIYNDNILMKYVGSGNPKSFKNIIIEIADSLYTNISLSSYKNGIRYYNTGFALCVILDKLCINYWKSRIENGETLTDLLREIIKFTNKDTSLLKEVKSSAEFLSHLNKAKQAIATEKEIIQKTFKAFNDS